VCVCVCLCVNTLHLLCVCVVFERSGMAMTTGAWTLGLVLGPAVGGIAD
jgi:hypothetical protein